MSLPPQLHPLVPQSGVEAELLPRLEALLASAPLGIAFLDRELRVERVNAALAKVLGRTIEECGGRTVHELAPALAELLLPVLERVLALGEGVPDFEFSGEAPGAPGSFRRWLAAFFPVRTTGGAIAGVGIILRDITGRYEARMRERRRTQHQETLHSLTAALAASMNAQDVIAAVIAHVSDIFGAVGSVVARITADGRQLEIVGANGMPADVQG